MNNIAEFILEEFNFVNSLIKPENRHNTRLMKWILSYIEILELLAIANFIHQEEQEKKERSKRTVWVWPYLQRRLEHGHYENLMEELAIPAIPTLHLPASLVHEEGDEMAGGEEEELLQEAKNEEEELPVAQSKAKPKSTQKKSGADKRKPESPVMKIGPPQKEAEPSPRKSVPEPSKQTLEPVPSVKVEYENSAMLGYEDAPMEELADKSEAGNMVDFDIKEEDIEVKEEAVEVKQENPETEESGSTARRGEKRALSPAHSPETKKQHPEVEQVWIKEDRTMWTEEKDELLASTVGNYEWLYHAANKHYKDITMKRNSWREVAQVVGLTVEECKARWTSLRDRYVRFRKTSNIPPSSGSGAGDVPTSKWCLYPRMHFMLHNTIQHRSGGDSLASTSAGKKTLESCVEDTSPPHIEIILTEGNVHQPSDNVEAEATEAGGASSRPTTKKRKRQTDKDFQDMMMERRTVMLEELCRAQSDPDDSLSKSFSYMASLIREEMPDQADQRKLTSNILAFVNEALDKNIMK